MTDWFDPSISAKSEKAKSDYVKNLHIKQAGHDVTYMSSMLANNLIKQRENLIRRAIEHEVNKSGTEFYEVSCKIHRYPDGHETVLVNDRPVLNFYPPTWEQERDDERQIIKLFGRQKYQWLI